MSKLDRELVRTLRTHFAAQDAAAAAEEHNIEVASNIELMLHPQSSSICFDAFVRHTQQMVMDFFPGIPFDVDANPVTHRPTAASSYGSITLRGTLPMGTFQCIISLEPDTPQTRGAPIHNIADARGLAVCFSADLFDRDGAPISAEDDPFRDWHGEGEQALATALDPVQYADYLTSMLPSSYWPRQLRENLDDALPVTGVEDITEQGVALRYAGV